MKDYSKDIRKLIARIPQGFECAKPGCYACCGHHAWSWTEWEKIEDKRYAESEDAPCPYASPEGCEVYEQRPVVCRLYGVCGNVGALPYWGQATPLNLKCPIGEPLVDGKTGHKLFSDYITIIRMEADDIKNSGASVIYAGPYGRFIGERNVMR